MVTEKVKQMIERLCPCSKDIFVMDIGVEQSAVENCNPNCSNSECSSQCISCSISASIADLCDPSCFFACPVGGSTRGAKRREF